MIKNRVFGTDNLGIHYLIGFEWIDEKEDCWKHLNVSQGISTEIYGVLKKGKRDRFTGLTDKNGKEVYEGDILKGNKTHNVVEWNGSECGFNVVEYGTHLFEIIGNIHEHSNLLS